VSRPWEDEPQGPLCEASGTRENADGYEFFWNCAQPGTVTADGDLMCEDHAGELGYGPKQEEYGYDPADETAGACSCPCDCPAPARRDDDSTPGWCDPCRMNIHQVEGAAQ
jgi:hypothetical protein